MRTVVTRRICRGCNNDPAVRVRFPVIRDTAPPRGEPTEAELDAMISEQRAALPPWWHEEDGR